MWNMVLRIYLEEKSAFISKGIQTQYNNLISWCAFDKTFSRLAFYGKEQVLFIWILSGLTLKGYHNTGDSTTQLAFHTEWKKILRIFWAKDFENHQSFFLHQLLIFWIISMGLNGSENNLIKTCFDSKMEMHFWTKHYSIVDHDSEFLCQMNAYFCTTKLNLVFDL